MIRTDAAVAEIRRRHKLTNVLHSALLLGGMAVLLALCGWVVAGGDGVAWVRNTRDPEQPFQAIANTGSTGSRTRVPLDRERPFQVMANG